MHMSFLVKFYIFLAFLIISCDKAEKTTSSQVIFGGGCFWTLDYYFTKIKGVEEVKCIYTNSKSEAVFIQYNPDEVSFKDLCSTFFDIHSPGKDYKAQYKSLIQTNNQKEKAIALEIIEKLKKKKPVKTVVQSMGEYTYPEEMHEDWYEKKNSSPKCSLPH